MALVVALVGGGAALGAASALAEAASRTAGFDSGVVTVHTVGSSVDVTHETRFSGTDWEFTQQGRTIVPGGQEERSDLSIRKVGGQRWQIDRTADGAAWAPSDVGANDDTGPRDAIAGDGLVDLVKAASGVTQDGSTFHATIDGAALQSVATLPFGLDGDATKGPVGITVTLTDAGTVGTLVISTPGVTRTADFSGLGSAQTIEAPTP